MSSDTTSSYDLIPYPDYTFPQTHPDRLAAVATLLGLRPPAVQTCRVLDLGCAAGANLIPMAEELPGATFVGVDLSRRQVEAGREAVAALGLTNVELRHQGLLDCQPGSETFDYVLCHGVFSWVPPEVQEHILAIARASLRPDGVAYVSYNTLPGWHIRGMIRDMMLYHVRRFAEAPRQIAEARALLDFLAASVPTEANPYGQFLRAELERLRKEPDSYLFHDYLEEHNEPVYFHRLVERAAAHGLRYLADADLYTMDPRNFPGQVGPTLERASADWVQLEQYMDFLRNRMFRQSLFGHADQSPRYRMEPEVLEPFFVGSPLRPTAPQVDLHATVREDFRTSSGATGWTSHPIVKATLVVLGEEWPRLLPFPEVCSRARARLGGEAAGEDRRLVGEALLRLATITGDLVELRLRPLPLTMSPGDRPRARRLARWQAAAGRPVTNLKHEQVNLDDFARQVLPRLDGEHTREEVARELAEHVATGRLAVVQEGAPVTGPARAGRVVRRALDEQVARFARQALLLA
jgi:methyltransferase-like protein/2-polyprenyl-3-methyl-5-hydroxy-6-metoxy-1,4-benzoquinol methylase